ncbi:uracil-DNA glycosylase-like [Adelges cooleyi]|uniref:uracil-DNA glycosylase-like n=1 Tax=Adelges cooleyi TaxID=133065 RepID=UPI0021805E4F|nr:uracil-DNA glycosylase-like [Adelges cooleyi]XP_050436651.1 uracil-DNA glycosylase-like [Adelges cooleyi]
MEQLCEDYPTLFPYVKIIEKKWYNNVLKDIFNKNPVTLYWIDRILSESSYQDAKGQTRFSSVNPDTAEAIWSWTYRTPLHKLKVVVIGQDPYVTNHPNGSVADGLAFSTKWGYLAPSLSCIFDAVHQQCGPHVDLTYTNLDNWARQGVLLLDTIMTSGTKPRSHRDLDWTVLTEAIIQSVCRYSLKVLKRPLIFLLWGYYAKSLSRHSYADDGSVINPVINNNLHKVLQSRHPSPVADRYFRNTFAEVNDDHFLKVNRILNSWNVRKIDWSTNEKSNYFKY